MLHYRGEPLLKLGPSELPGLPARDTTGDEASVGAGHASSGATVSDSAELEVQRGEPPPPRGGPGDTAGMGDSADLVVRDAAGNIKQQETVR